MPAKKSGSAELPQGMALPVLGMAKMAYQSFDQIVVQLEKDAPNFDAVVRSAVAPLEALENECRKQADTSRQAGPLGTVLSMMSTFGGPNAMVGLKDVGEDLNKAARLAAGYDALAEKVKAVREDLQGILAEDRDSVLKVTTGLRDVLKGVVAEVEP